MKQLFIPYELAVIAKEKGFPNNSGSCLAAWEVNDDMEFLHFGSHPIGLLKAPLYQQIVDWFREKHNILITLLPDKEEGKLCYHTIIDTNTDYSYSLIRRMARDKSERLEVSFNYYKALNKAIEESFKLI